MAHPLSSGIISAAIMPFNNDGSIDWKTLERYIPEVAAGGPKGIALNMDASEGYSLSLQEHVDIVKFTSKLLKGSGVTMISGLLTSFNLQASEHAKRLVDAGAEALAIFPPIPIFLGRPTKEMVLDYHNVVAEAVDVPLISFQVPTSMVDYPEGTIVEFSKIKNMVAMKEATFDVSRTRLSVMEAASAPKKIGILTGSDTFILEAMLLGCDGALIGFAAAFTKEIVKMQQFAEKGDVAAAFEIWEKLGPMARFGWESPIREYRVRMKYVLEVQGVIPSSQMRRPAPQIPAQDRRFIEDLSKKYGYRDARWMPSGRALTKASGVAA
jgi:4-hydroxy-tetrahydrodipicolinate synthase